MNKRASLTPGQCYVINDKGTELAFSGKFIDAQAISGTYLCRACGLALFRADSQFTSGCGWPSFDDEIANAVKRKMDPDGRRTEILCNRCDAHLGHAFTGEKLTTKNLRHCVNSISIEFVADTQVNDTEEAMVAAGCFWGVEYLFQKLPGVLKTEVGYSGGDIVNPTYQQVCNGDTGHVEVLRIIYDTEKLSYKDVIKYFFEIHDSSQADGQGPDIGSQYLSVVFYYNETQKQITSDVIKQLEQLNIHAATQLKSVKTFGPPRITIKTIITKPASSRIAMCILNDLKINKFVSLNSLRMN